MNTQYNKDMIDPKPNLSRAAIEANIAYCQAKQDHHLALVQLFKKKEQEYVEMLLAVNDRS